MLACSVALRSGRSPRSVSRPVCRVNTRYVSRISKFNSIRTYSSAHENQEAFPDGKYQGLPRNEMPDILYSPDEVIDDYHELARLLIAHDEQTLLELEELKNNDEEMKKTFLGLQAEFPREYGKLTYDKFRESVLTALDQSRAQLNDAKLDVGEPSEAERAEAEDLLILKPGDLDGPLNNDLPEGAREVLQTAKDIMNDLQAPTARFNELEQYISADYPEDLRGPFGTRDHPVIVPSFYPTRVVGCSGDYPENEHGLLWHIVNETRPTICLECGQYFKLKKLDESLLDDEVSGRGDRTVEYLI